MFHRASNAFKSHHSYFSRVLKWNIDRSWVSCLLVNKCFEMFCVLYLTEERKIIISSSFREKIENTWFRCPKTQKNGKERLQALVWCWSVSAPKPWSVSSGRSLGRKPREASLGEEPRRWCCLDSQEFNYLVAGIFLFEVWRSLLRGGKGCLIRIFKEVGCERSVGEEGEFLCSYHMSQVFHHEVGRKEGGRRVIPE